jgi:hypothetical protein
MHKFVYKTLQFPMQAGTQRVIDLALPADVVAVKGVAVNVAGLGQVGTEEDMTFMEGLVQRDGCANGEVVLNSQPDAAWFQHNYNFNADNYRDTNPGDQTRYDGQPFMPVDIGRLERIGGYVRDRSRDLEPRYFPFPLGYVLLVTIQYLSKPLRYNGI